MTVKTIVLLIAITLTAITSAKANYHQEFCGERYCGHINSFEPVYKVHKKAYKKKIHHKAVKVHRTAKKLTSEPKPVNQPASELLQEAKKYLGGNPTGWRSLWCARFIAFLRPAIAERLKRMGLNPNWARDYAKLPGAKHSGNIGDLVVLSSRGSGGHIGILKDFDERGNPIIISGNHGHKVGIGTYSKSRVIAYASI